ncbi:hypothetical protein KVH27_34885 [Streptomyces olivaceus]|uniref:hypothetical protein n=1 Tax=Streptomyces olivaceus TaxID=47716 RepID=UPI001CCB2643|nr:hypothetical protein [Streptomyces olivaceus]MBZ6253537.1 hypothetical protein [Streptomyces olivaceus]
MRMPRFLARRPRPAALLAAGLATTLLGAAAVIGPDPQAGTPLPAPLVTVTALAVSDDDIATAYNDGWTEGQDDLMAADCTEPVPTAPKTDDPLVTAYNDGWIDGQLDLIDNGACSPRNLHTGTAALPQAPGTE